MQEYNSDIDEPADMWKKLDEKLDSAASGTGRTTITSQFNQSKLVVTARTKKEEEGDRSQLHAGTVAFAVINNPNAEPRSELLSLVIKNDLRITVQVLLSVLLESKHWSQQEGLLSPSGVDNRLGGNLPYLPLMSKFLPAGLGKIWLNLTPKSSIDISAISIPAFPISLLSIGQHSSQYSISWMQASCYIMSLCTSLNYQQIELAVFANGQYQMKGEVTNQKGAEIFAATSTTKSSVEL
ncbi:hypothetical protein HOY80DRAFT_1030149 [Tuber brumale]|nr:hypothetical protein HOY80DRAFT_1030149 [Tuber brumale]